MTYEEYQQKRSELEEREDEIFTAVEEGRLSEDSLKKVSEELTALDQEFDSSRQDEEQGEESQEPSVQSSSGSEPEEPPTTAGDTQFRDDQGRYAKVPEQKHRDDMARRYPSMI